ncbi:MAG: amidohydrolase, partial [Candidatus Asgardarchaeum californiense]
MIREEPSPSIIIHNGHVLSFNDEKFTALAIENNKILAVGNDKEILYLKNEQSRIIDAKGCTIIPGLIDAHTHFV